MSVVIQDRVSDVTDKFVGTCKFIFILVAIYLSTFIFEAPIRYVLNLAGAGSLLYLRDGIPVIIISLICINWMRGKYNPTILLVIIYLLLLHFFVGMIYIHSLFQQLFGLKVLLPLILGVAIFSVYKLPLIKFRQYIAYVFLIIVLAILINKFYVFPWEGATFDTIFGQGEQARDWTAGGVRRLSGFSRASFDAASALLILVTYLLAAYKNTCARVLFWLLAFIGIALTTSKGAMLAALILLLLMIFNKGENTKPLYQFVLVGLVMLVVLMPIISLLINVRVRDISSEWAWWFTSYADRMEWMWPKAFELLDQHGSYLLGRGLGGIGVSQMYGDGRWINAADNIFVYLTVTFGIVGWIYCGVILTKLFIYKAKTSRENFLIFAFPAIALAYGMSVGVIEQPLLSFTLGAVIGWIFRSMKPS
ncbi:O-antigen ligase family protein [Methylobacillus methanolivorans]|uniref:O-antigen ligase family protein n=1 Tax=Methylobacillus methanolivorans TaxID=1848927 RepID=A0ABW8GH22_9PROT